jgi:hypothetical protein
MVFRVLQHYSDGNTARWIEPPAADGTEPENDPAPVLKLLPAAAAAGTPPAGQPAVVPQNAASSTEDEDDSAALGLAIAGLVAGLAGLALGGLAFARTRRQTAPPAA